MLIDTRDNNIPASLNESDLLGKWYFLISVSECTYPARDPPLVWS